VSFFKRFTEIQVSFLLKNVPDIVQHGKNYGLKSHEMSVLKIGPPTILWIIEACQILSKVAPLETPGLSREVTSRTIIDQGSGLLSTILFV
jgi:hypothetical protein